MNETLEIYPGQMTYTQLRDVYQKIHHIEINDNTYSQINKAEQFVQSILEKGDTVYGINTGFGLLARTTIDQEKLHQLQHNLVISHAVGTGPLLDNATVRLAMTLKVNALAQGYSGCSPKLIEMMVKIINAGITPCVPAKGSVGASGDLAPLSHIAMTVLGEGEVFFQGQKVNAKKALNDIGLQPYRLGPKEGLALVNGTEVSTAIALSALFKMDALYHSTLLAGALTTDAIKGSDKPFFASLHKVRQFKSQMDVAQALTDLLEGSEIRESHSDCENVQDPYCIRCQPQVLGACLHHSRFVAETLLTEANGVHDNPIIFSDLDMVVSGGNFHAEPVAIAADLLAVCIAEIGGIAERRIALMIDPNLSNLPAYLIQDSGLNSGYACSHTTASALANENKTLASPAAVHSLPTFANQEDHISMATYGAYRLHQMIENVATINAIELLCAAQGLDFHKPLTTSAHLQPLYEFIRAQVPFIEKDEQLYDHIEWMKQQVIADNLPWPENLAFSCS